MKTDVEKLTAIIERAVKNGFDFGSEPFTKEEIKYKQYYYVIFDHAFCKAFWGEELIKVGQMDTEMGNHFPIKQEAWRYHIQQLSLAENRIEYLWKFMEEQK